MPRVITDNQIWDESIPAIQNGDDLDDATLNIPTQALANRTAFLDKKIDDTATEINLEVLTQVGAVNERVDAVVPNTFLPGQVIYYAGAVVPAGWLPCDGGQRNRVDFPLLYAAIQDIYKLPGDNSTTQFRLPNLYGEFIRCLNPTLAGIDAGRTLTATAQTDEIKSHTHTIPTKIGLQNFNTASGAAAWQGEQAGTTGSVGGTETRPHNVALHAIIKT